MSTAQKIDLFKLHRAQYVARSKPVLVEVDEARYLSVEGVGEPGGDQFQEKTAGLYAVAYTVKMSRKAKGLEDYVICKLEGLWSHESDPLNFALQPKEEWRWQLMIRTPDFVTEAELAEASEKLVAKGKTPEVRNVSLVSHAEGQCVQMLHVGPYDKEGETVEKMEAFAREQGLCLQPRHHEIYLSDPRRVEPERLKTILRLPVAPQ